MLILPVVTGHDTCVCWSSGTHLHRQNIAEKHYHSHHHHIHTAHNYNTPKHQANVQYGWVAFRLIAF